MDEQDQSRRAIDDIFRLFGGDHEERTYRFRCFEAWAMDVPWAGFSLNKLLKLEAGPDGAFYVSDDYARTIYRVVYAGAGASLGFAAPPAQRLGERGNPLALLDATEKK